MWLLLSFCPQNLGGGCYQQVCYCNFMKLARHIHLCPKYKYYCHRALGMQKPPLWQGCSGSNLGTRVHTQSINIIVMPNLIICTLTLWEIWSSSKLLKNIFYEHFEVFWWSSYVASKLTSLYQVLCLTNLLHGPAVWLFEIWQTISNSLKYVFSE